MRGRRGVGVILVRRRVLRARPEESQRQHLMNEGSSSTNLTRWFEQMVFSSSRLSTFHQLSNYNLLASQLISGLCLGMLRWRKVRGRRNWGVSTESMAWRWCWEGRRRETFLRRRCRELSLKSGAAQKMLFRLRSQQQNLPKLVMKVCQCSARCYPRSESSQSLLKREARVLAARRTCCLRREGERSASALKKTLECTWNLGTKQVNWTLQYARCLAAIQQQTRTSFARFVQNIPIPCRPISSQHSSRTSLEDSLTPHTNTPQLCDSPSSSSSQPISLLTLSLRMSWKRRAASRNLEKQLSMVSLAADFQSVLNIIFSMLNPYRISLGSSLRASQLKYSCSTFTNLGSPLAFSNKLTPRSLQRGFEMSGRVRVKWQKRVLGGREPQLRARLRCVHCLAASWALREECEARFQVGQFSYSQDQFYYRSQISMVFEGPWLRQAVVFSGRLLPSLSKYSLNCQLIRIDRIASPSLADQFSQSALNIQLQYLWARAFEFLKRGLSASLFFWQSYIIRG